MERSLERKDSELREHSPLAEQPSQGSAATSQMQRRRILASEESFSLGKLFRFPFYGKWQHENQLGCSRCCSFELSRTSRLGSNELHRVSNCTSLFFLAQPSHPKMVASPLLGGAQWKIRYPREYHGGSVEKCRELHPHCTATTHRCLPLWWRINESTAVGGTAQEHPSLRTPQQWLADTSFG